MVEGTPHCPAQITVPEILFYIDGVVVELDTKRPVVPGGPRPSKKAIRCSNEKEHGIHRCADGTVSASGMLGVVFEGHRGDKITEPGAVEDQLQPVAGM